VDDRLAESGGIRPGSAVTAVLAVAAVSRAAVGQVVAVGLIVPSVSEECVVAAAACRRAADGGLIPGNQPVVPGAAVNHVVPTVGRDHTAAGEDCVVADEEEVVPVTAGNGVVPGASGHK